MSGSESLILRAALIGVGATIILDLWAVFFSRALKMPGTNWSLVGRWIGHIPRGRFVHESIARADAVHGEAAIGWVAHCVIGIGYGLVLLVFSGKAWLLQPTLIPPLLLSWALLLAPFFIMMPGMGSGVAGSKTPKPHLTRLRSFISHSIFGIGMYATGIGLARLWPIPT